VKPVHLRPYEQTTKEFIALVQQHREASPAFHFTDLSLPAVEK